MKNEIKCTSCKEGQHLQKRLENFPEDFEMYKCEVCGAVWEYEKIVSLKDLLSVEIEQKQLKDIRLHSNTGSMGLTIQVNYGNGWEKIKKHIEK